MCSENSTPTSLFGPSIGEEDDQAADSKATKPSSSQAYVADRDTHFSPLLMGHMIAAAMPERNSLWRGDRELFASPLVPKLGTGNVRVRNDSVSAHDTVTSRCVRYEVDGFRSSLAHTM